MGLLMDRGKCGGICGGIELWSTPEGILLNLLIHRTS